MENLNERTNFTKFREEPKAFQQLMSDTTKRMDKSMFVNYLFKITNPPTKSQIGILKIMR